MYRSWWVFGMLHKDTRMASVFSIHLIVSWLMFIVGIFQLGFCCLWYPDFLYQPINYHSPIIYLCNYKAALTHKIYMDLYIFLLFLIYNNISIILVADGEVRDNVLQCPVVHWSSYYYCLGHWRPSEGIVMTHCCTSFFLCCD